MNSLLITNLSKLMVEYDLSENELARRSGVHQPTIHRILKGESKDPRRSNVSKIAAVFGRTASDLLGETQAEVGIREDSGIYDVSARNIPVLEWTQAKEWNKALNSEERYKNWISVPAHGTKDWFALPVLNDSMTCVGGLSVPQGAKLAVDPHEKPKNGDLVVAFPANSSEATFKKLVIDAGILQLHPLNNRYPTLNLESLNDVIGVVKSAVLTF